MTVKVMGFDGNPFDQNSIVADGGRFIATLVQFVLSGNYVAGGDTLDFTNGGGSAAFPSTVPSAQNRGIAQIDLRPISKVTGGLVSIGGSYSIIAPGGVIPVPLFGANSIQNLKLKLFLVTNAEYTAGAYGSDALGDIVMAKVYWAR